MKTRQGADAGGRGGWWSRLSTWLSHLFAPLEPVPVPTPEPVGALTLRRDLAGPIVVPARGYVYDFQIHAVLTWMSDGLRRDELVTWSQRFTPRARHALSRLAANATRNFPAHRARDVEVELNRALTGKPWCFQHGDITVRCRADVSVRLDDRVKEYLQPSWEKRIKMEADHEVSLRRAQLADQLSRRWLSIMDNLRGSPAAASAARLADKELAEVMRDLSVEQRETTGRLMSLLEEAIRNNGRSDGGVGQYEVAEVFDLLNQMIRQQAPRPANGGRLG